MGLVREGWNPVLDPHSQCVVHMLVSNESPSAGKQIDKVVRAWWGNSWNQNIQVIGVE